MSLSMVVGVQQTPALRGGRRRMACQVGEDLGTQGWRGVNRFREGLDDRLSPPLTQGT